MNKYIISLIILLTTATSSYAARAVLDAIGVPANLGVFRAAVNDRISKIQANDIELYAADGTKANITSVFQDWNAYANGFSHQLDTFTYYGGKIWKVVIAHTKGAGTYPGNSGNQWVEFTSGTGVGGATNLSAVAGATTVAVNSDTGNDATLPSATTAAAGVMTAVDKTKLDSVASGATANSSDATLLSRTNHTNTQPWSTISDFASGVTTAMASYISKLNGIQSGATVQIQSDWNQATNTALDYIKNKPTVFTVDSDQTITGEKTFQDIILPYFDTLGYNLLTDAPTCSAGSYFTFFRGSTYQQCFNGTISNVGTAGASMTWPSAAGIAVYGGSSAWGSSLTLDTDMSSGTNTNTAVPTTLAVQNAIAAVTAGSIPHLTADPSDPSTGYSWINTTDGYLRSATAGGVYSVQMTLAGDDHTPAAFTFTDQTGVTAGSGSIVSAAVNIDGLGLRATDVSVSGDAGCGWQVSTDTGNSTFSSCTSSAGTVNNDADTQIKACVNASASGGTTTSCAVTVGTVSDTFSVTTTAETGDSEVVFYFNANSATSGQSPQKGSGTIAIPTSFTTTTGSVGNALYSNNTEWDDVTIPVSGNLSASVGTIGFFFNPIAAQAGAYAFTATGSHTNSSPKFYLMNTDGGTGWEFGYRSSIEAITLTANTVVFIELSWDNSGNKMSYRVNGGSWSEVSVTGTAVTLDTNLSLSYNHTYNISATWDQILISNVYQKDLYAVRTNTSF